MDNTGKSKKAVIDRFLADNPELEELSAKLSTFNFFRALRIEDAEIRHSNVLAWLLNPEESHGLGDVFIKRLLSNMLLLSEKTIEGLSAAKVELMDFTDIEIRREWRHIDLLVIDRTNKLAILIENKIHSSESPGQLIKYIRAVEEEFSSYVNIPVLLTLVGQGTIDDSTADFICYSYAKLLKVVEKIYTQRLEQLAQPVVFFIKHYMEVLRRLTMQDESLVELCKTIYRRHRDAIDTIVKYGMVGAGQQAVEDVLAEAEEYEILYSRASSVWFIPKSWAKILPNNGIIWSGLARPVGVACWFEFWKSGVMLHFELSKMKDPHLRPLCAKKLHEAGFKLLKKALDEKATYSRFFGKKQHVSDITDYDEVKSAVAKLMAKAKVEFPKAEKVFQEVFRNIKD